MPDMLVSTTEKNTAKGELEVQKKTVPKLERCLLVLGKFPAFFFFEFL